MSSESSFGMMPPPYKQGQALWTVVNGEPALRYYVRPQDRGHVIAFCEETLAEGYYVDFGCFWPSRSAVLLWLIEGIQFRIECEVKQLKERHQQLMDC